MCRIHSHSLTLLINSTTLHHSNPPLPYPGQVQDCPPSPEPARGLHAPPLPKVSPKAALSTSSVYLPFCFTPPPPFSPTSEGSNRPPWDSRNTFSTLSWSPSIYPPRPVFPPAPLIAHLQRDKLLDDSTHTSFSFTATLRPAPQMLTE